MSAHDHGNPESQLTGLLARVLGPAGPEATCEECSELLDQYVDLEVAGAHADTRLPAIRAHLEGCPACHEEYESLRDLVAGGSAQLRSGDGS